MKCKNCGQLEITQEVLDLYEGTERGLYIASPEKDFKEYIAKNKLKTNKSGGWTYYVHARILHNARRKEVKELAGNYIVRTFQPSERRAFTLRRSRS